LRIASPRPADGQAWTGRGVADAGARRPEPPLDPLSRPDAVASQSFAPLGAARAGSFEQAQSQLTTRGVIWQRLETVGDHGDWKFACSVPNPQNRLISRTYEATARDPLSAIQAVLDQISKER
jgi:hypothetical protein